MAKRVRNEVALHKKLRHTNILTLYHYFEDDERVYLVMELCSHGELYSLLKRRRESGGNLTENEARIILRDVVAGLKFLHSHGIIHRDLKLSNILLSETGQAKIADFGLAVLTEFSDSDSRERTICGTPNYLAPEILNKKNYGRSADIWSLGCLLYSFLTGKPPFDSPDLPQTFDKVKRLDYKIPDHLSPSARDLISRLLSGDPVNRPTFDQIIWHPFFNPAVSDPLSTRRLNPLKQMTKYGSIEILQNGNVSIDFLDSSDVLIISSDGLRIESVDKSTGHQISSSITNLNNNLNVSTAASIKRRYEYARRFINLVKAKTPLIILSALNFKAYLMENSVGSSTGDFHINYRDGVKRIEYCWVSRQLRIFDSPTNLTPILTINDPSHQILSEIPSPLHREMLLEFLARYKQCIQIRDGLIHADGTERSKYRGTKFPLIIKENNDNTNTSGSMSMSMSISNFNINTSSLSYPDVNSKRNQCAFPNVRKYLPGIGWCLSLTTTSNTTNTTNTNQTDDEHYFLVLFNDGRSIQIDGHADTVLDLQTNRLLPINSRLPDDIKEMLALFSKFL
jgi:serine/threonine protein kinase